MSDISYNRRVHYYIAQYELFQEQECLHCMDIARKLSISLPAASRMLQKLISEGLIEKKSYQSICLTQAGKGQLQTTYHTYCELISYFSRIPTFTEEDRLESSLLCLGSFPHSRIEKLVRSADCIGTEKLVSGEYNSDVFVFGNSDIRKLLADIQIEEQNHAEMLWKYKTANGMA